MQISSQTRFVLHFLSLLLPLILFFYTFLSHSPSFSLFFYLSAFLLSLVLSLLYLTLIFRHITSLPPLPFPLAGHSVVRLPVPEVSYYSLRGPMKADENKFLLLGGFDGNNQSTGQNFSILYQALSFFFSLSIPVFSLLFSFLFCSNISFLSLSVNTKVFRKDGLFEDWEEQPTMPACQRAFQTASHNPYHIFISLPEALINRQKNLC